MTRSNAYEQLHQWCVYLTAIGSFLWLAGALASRPLNVLDVSAAALFVIATILSLRMLSLPRS